MNKNVLSLALVTIGLSQPSLAQTPDDIAKLTVLPGWETAQGTHMTGLRIDLATGWKTYWRAPGDAGIPPLFVIDPTSNLADAIFHWPVPDVFDQNGIRSIGYHDSVVLPVEMTRRSADAPMQLTGSLDIGVCMDICVPIRLEFNVILPDESYRNPAIVAAMLDQPSDGAASGLPSVVCDVAPHARGLALTATLAAPALGNDEALAIEAGDPTIYVAEPTLRRNGDILTATTVLEATSGKGIAIDRSRLRFTLLGGSEALDMQGCVRG